MNSKHQAINQHLLQYGTDDVIASYKLLMLQRNPPQASFIEPEKKVNIIDLTI